MVRTINHDGQLLAIIISHEFSEAGIHFFTPEHFSQQLAFMSHPAGKTIRPHIHNRVTREVHFTQEVLIIKKGKLRVDFYDDQYSYIMSRILNAGDIILLATGGHGFEVLEQIEMIEVKQGPYANSEDKICFPAVPHEQVRLDDGA